jgi:hypothetical protein
MNLEWVGIAGASQNAVVSPCCSSVQEAHGNCGSDPAGACLLVDQPLENSGDARGTSYWPGRTSWGCTRSCTRSCTGAHGAPPHNSRGRQDRRTYIGGRETVKLERYSRRSPISRRVPTYMRRRDSTFETLAERRVLLQSTPPSSPS